MSGEGKALALSKRVPPQIKLGEDYYVLASSLASRRSTRVLAGGDSFAIFEAGGDILESPLEALGFFHRDTRYLSRFEIRIAGQIPHFLNSYTSDDNVHLRVNLTNPDISAPDGGLLLARDSLQIERGWVLVGPRMYHRCVVRNYAASEVELALEFIFGNDFADLFEVRGVKRKRRGEVLAPEATRNSVRLRYRGLDGIARLSEIVFEPTPHKLTAHRASFVLRLKPEERVVIETQVMGSLAGAALESLLPGPQSFDGALHTRTMEVAEFSRERVRITTSNELMDSLLHSSFVDLAMITQETGEGDFIMAGIPWYATLFGRDSLITALLLLPFWPNIAAGTLRVLARMQGAEISEQRDEQPGKIVHEVRHGEMARTGEIPFGRYYGSVDATPLFLWLLGSYVAVTGDWKLAEELWPNVDRALHWIDHFGDRDGDGYVEYQREAPHGLSNQGWKDSFDAISHADGSLARAPIALCEVQGYVYAAWKMIAEVATRLGQRTLAGRLNARARSLKDKFGRDFWFPDERTLILALDAHKRPCRVVASNAAHCMATGLLDGDRAVATCDRILRDDMFSGWGIRTLSTHERRYNPMSYHNGSVWPHDNALAAMGMARVGCREGVMKLLGGMFEAAMQLRAGSLPELFCGFAREPRLGPVPYPVACHPQAWSAASVFQMIAALLGIQVDGFESLLILNSPQMPPWLDWIKVERLRVGEGAVSFIARRAPGGAPIEILEKRGDVTVQINK